MYKVKGTNQIGRKKLFGLTIICIEILLQNLGKNFCSGFRISVQRYKLLPVKKFQKYIL